MNDLETRLAELLKAGVGDPPSRVTVEAVRQQRARRQVLAGVTAVVVIALLAGVSASLLIRLGGAGPAVRPGLTAGIPRYYVEEASQRRFGTAVRETATGRVTATVRCPWRNAAPEIYPIAAASGQRFFMVCTANTHRATAQARIYQFQVTRSGQVRGYALIPGGQLGDVTVGSMAVASDGSSVAVIVAPPQTGPATTPQAQIVVINTRTGARAIWRNPPAESQDSRFRLFDVSFTADGRELVFLGTRVCGSGTHPRNCQPLHQQVRALSPPADGGLLSAGQNLFDTVEVGTSRFITNAAVSADGSTLTLVTVNVPPKPQPSTVTVSQALIGTRGQRVIYQTRGSSGLEPDVFFNADASGRHFLINAGPSGHPANGWIHHGRLIKLEPSGTGVFYEAW
jgi:hypothetical protein